ncbi:hypothetical protein C4J65_34725 [Streptomyces sp. CB09001]|uniref:acyl-CoA carboxylase subunit epsilon n=1 Tax=Streptomyces sp. CB09001 TaxID=2083284 RepID=UPI000E219AAC|nr:acyl-CoA carboxylase subunit epsilon [Streptomyces sp. CB09001]AXL92862.1 hypothetical protein C4J65_34725 [Streptomyces sp. CB09001]
MTIKVLRGNPTPEELAAALTVVRARTAVLAAVPDSTPVTMNAWSHPGRIAQGRGLRPDSGAWTRTYWRS